MSLIVYTDQSSRMDRMMNRLAANTDITDFSPGTIARAYIEIMNEEIEECYSTLDRYLSMAYLSEASGRFLDLLGRIVNCTRYSGETDDNFRYRISQQVYTAAGANETSIRIKALAVAGVNDVYIHKYAYGIGSFAIYVISEDPNTPDSVIDAVQDVIDQEQGCGILGIATKPKLLTLDLGVKLYMRTSTSQTEADSSIYTAKTIVKRLIDNMPMGETFSVGKVLSGVVSNNDNIVNAEATEIKINNKATFFQTYTPNWDERIILRNLTVA